MNYLVIKNDGLICAEDLTLIGSSTKRDSVGKIGMFGSGWKYALAWLLRNDCKPVIFAGDEQIEIDFAVKLHRNNPVNVITVNGIETSLTTEMGPKWTGWMALREVLSNAIDEGGYSITTSWLPEFKGFKDQTVIYIPMGSELSEVMVKFDSYFAFYRKESYLNETCRMFFKTEESNLNVYRKGIRCYDTNTRTKVDFDFNDVYISEDRLTSSGHIEGVIKKMVSEGLPTHILKRLLKEENQGWMPVEPNNIVLENLKEMVNQGECFTTKTLQKLGGLLFSNANAFLIPAGWFKKLEEMGLVKSPFENISQNKVFMRTDAKDIKGFAYHLSGFNITLPILSGKCEGDVFINGNTIYVKDDTTLSDKDLVGEFFYTMSRAEIVSLVA